MSCKKKTKLLFIYFFCIIFVFVFLFIVAIEKSIIYKDDYSFIEFHHRFIDISFVEIELPYFCYYGFMQKKDSMFLLKSNPISKNEIIFLNFNTCSKIDTIKQVFINSYQLVDINNGNFIFEYYPKEYERRGGGIATLSINFQKSIFDIKIDSIPTLPPASK